MVSYEIIKRMNDEIESLESKIRDLERKKSSLKTDRDHAKAVSNVGMATMAVDLTVGLSSKTIADHKVREIEEEIRKVDDKIYDYDKQLHKLVKEYSLLLKQWDEERVEAELVVEGDKVYIKGDNEKRDILENVKSVRNNLRTRYDEIKNNERVISFLDTRMGLVNEFQNRGFANRADSSKSEMAKEIGKIESYVKFTCTEEIEGYYVPKSDFDKVVISTLKDKISARQEEIAEQKRTYENMRPGFFGKIFKSVYNKKYLQAKAEAEKEIEVRERLIKEYEREISVVSEFRNKFPNFHDDDLKKMIKDYRSKRDSLEENNQLHLAKEIVDIVKRLQENKCIVQRDVFIPYEVKKYLLDNNLSLSNENVLECIASMEELDKEIKKDVKNILDNEKSYSPMNQVKKRY